jgi:hypothetical protein
MLYPATVDVLAVQPKVTEGGTTPVPVNVTIAGEPVALLTIVILPAAAPVAVGLNWTARTTFWVGVSVTGAPPPVIE